MKNARKEPTDENEKDMFFAYTTFVTPNTLTPIHHSECAHSVLACRGKKEEKRSNKNKLIAQKSNKIIKKNNNKRKSNILYEAAHVLGTEKT